MSRSYLSDADSSQVVTDSIVVGRTNGNIATQTAKFRALNPDSRVRLKISVFFVRDNIPVGALPVTAMPTTLYLGEEEHSKKQGRRVLCTDILRDATGNVIHQSAPLTIPEDPGLEGFTIEFVTAADSVLGIIASSSPGGTGLGGHWIAQARWQPEGQRLCDEDWDAVRRKCQLQNVGDPMPGNGS